MTTRVVVLPTPTRPATDKASTTLVVRSSPWSGKALVSAFVSLRILPMSLAELTAHTKGVSSVIPSRPTSKATRRVPTRIPGARQSPHGRLRHATLQTKSRYVCLCPEMHILSKLTCSETHYRDQHYPVWRLGRRRICHIGMPGNMLRPHYEPVQL